MEKIAFGKTGMSLSKYGFGGIPVQRLSMAEASGLILKAFHLGMNWIDTANSYGHSEESAASALENFGREKIHVFSKAQGDSPELIYEQVKTSLERMKLSYIDLYQLHLVRSCEDWKKKLDNGTLDKLVELRRKGIIRHVGASAHKLDVVLEILEHSEIEAVQFPFNFIAEDIGIRALEKARKKGAGFIAMKPFGGGMIGNAEAAIHFLNQYPDLVSDPGFEHPDEIRQVISLSSDKVISDEDKNNILQIKNEMGVKFCRRCEYCSPCPRGVDIVKMMTLESMAKRLPGEAFQGKKMRGAAESVENCTECGICETKCPYNLKIRDRIKEGALLYKKLIKSL